MFKAPLAVLLLFLYLFPQVQKGSHDFEHRNDLHCDAASEVHLHQLEHTCVLCDITISVANESDFIDRDFIFHVVSFFYKEIFVHDIVTCCWQLLPSRAPPFS